MERHYIRHSYSLAFALIIALPVFAASDLTLPEGWFVYPGSSIEKAALECAKYSQREWQVLFEEGRLTIRPYLSSKGDALPFPIVSQSFEDGLSGRPSVRKVEDGWIIGFFKGEFGGNLWWFNIDGTSRQLLANGPVVFFADTSSDLLAFVGLKHLTSDRGEVLRVQHKNSGWQATHLADLHEMPRASIMESSDSLLVLTSTSLFRMHATGSLKLLFKQEYRYLYPNSMTLSPLGTVYVGLRHFVSRLTPNERGYKTEWLLPVDCAKFEKRALDCVCMIEEKP